MTVWNVFIHGNLSYINCWLFEMCLIMITTHVSCQLFEICLFMIANFITTIEGWQNDTINIKVLFYSIFSVTLFGSHQLIGVIFLSPNNNPINFTLCWFEAILLSHVQGIDNIHKRNLGKEVYTAEKGMWLTTIFLTIIFVMQWSGVGSTKCSTSLNDWIGVTYCTRFWYIMDIKYYIKTVLYLIFYHLEDNAQTWELSNSTWYI